MDVGKQKRTLSNSVANRPSHFYPFSIISSTKRYSTFKLTRLKAVTVNALSCFFK
jgi:hypothetical protein